MATLSATTLGAPVAPFFTVSFLGEASPTKIDYRKEGSLILTLLEDLAVLLFFQVSLRVLPLLVVHQGFSWIPRGNWEHWVRFLPKSPEVLDVNESIRRTILLSCGPWLQGTELCFRVSSDQGPPDSFEVDIAWKLQGGQPLGSKSGISLHFENGRMCFFFHIHMHQHQTSCSWLGQKLKCWPSRNVSARWTRHVSLILLKG